MCKCMAGNGLRFYGIAKQPLWPLRCNKNTQFRSCGTLGDNQLWKGFEYKRLNGEWYVPGIRTVDGAILPYLYSDFCEYMYTQE